MAVCAACGEVLIGWKKFCAYCGAPAAEAPEGSRRASSAPPPVATALPLFPVGARVLVKWADGNQYAGIVQQVAPGQCLVVFPDGQQRWVDPRDLTGIR